ncbi:hypothetical protein KM176_11125 [Pseudooceanicola sp. CBS1P-1]|uniref:Uncharacterized protein n=1 Tax=Pseudooceanicola albus TaxID=2692189 RepID=A0A6L7G705_9RHOB|nr:MULTISPECIES: hypothetical protein [Pseudooceanicola]MBT9384411.1 hypothetical protein [Pseudooceanicola endophyticus]MXN19851.1 hypothetical protein [Pseudooceanicola albus]
MESFVILGPVGHFCWFTALRAARDWGQAFRRIPYRQFFYRIRYFSLILFRTAVGEAMNLQNKGEISAVQALSRAAASQRLVDFIA